MNEKKSHKTVMTISGIRPDFIRMSKVFQELDKEFNHILVHTGQHYDELLSGVFFEDLNIRKPDHFLNVGKQSSNHFEQISNLTMAIHDLLSKVRRPSLIIFLGDSNTVGVSFSLKKEGYKICHIEAGMRSFDRRMLEEINRTVCDVCSDIHFTYHINYKQHLYEENINKDVYVVGNTVVEPCLEFAQILEKTPKTNEQIILDIHRPENFKYESRMKFILSIAQWCGKIFRKPVKMLKFFGTLKYMEKFNIDIKKYDCIEIVDLMSYKNYLTAVYNSKFVISDSGTAGEECPLLKTPVIVPRDYTERPESYINGCAFPLHENTGRAELYDFLNEYNPKVEWLRNGLNENETTSKKIVEILKELQTNKIF